MAFSITIRETQGVTVLDLSGELVIGEALTALREQTKQLLAANKTKIVVNMKKITYFDDSITTLIPPLFSTRKQGGDLKLVPSRDIDRVLKDTRLNYVFEVYATEDEALASFK